MRDLRESDWTQRGGDGWGTVVLVTAEDGRQAALAEAVAAGGYRAIVCAPCDLSIVLHANAADLVVVMDDVSTWERRRCEAVHATSAQAQGALITPRPRTEGALLRLVDAFLLVEPPARRAA